MFLHTAPPHSSRKVAGNVPVNKGDISAIIYSSTIFSQRNRQSYGESQSYEIGSTSLEPSLGYRQWEYNPKPYEEGRGGERI